MFILKKSFRLLFLLIFLFQGAQSYCQKPQKTYKVSGTVTHTRSYCGGARPSDEMLEKLNTPTPLPGTILYIRSGPVNQAKRKIIKTIVADSAGRFSVHLPPGQYIIIQDNQVKSLNVESFRKMQTQYLKLNEDCLKKWWSDGLLIIEVKAGDVKNLNINFNTSCFTGEISCMEYTGPLPP